MVRLRRSFLLFVFGAQCSPALPPHPLDQAYATAVRAEVGPGDQLRCGALERGMRAARARGDDRAADLGAERLSTVCPGLARGLLAVEGSGVRYRPDPTPATAKIGVAYEL